MAARLGMLTAFGFGRIGAIGASSAVLKQPLKMCAPLSVTLQPFLSQFLGLTPTNVQHRSISTSGVRLHYAERGIKRIQERAKKLGLRDPLKGQKTIVYGRQLNCPSSPWKLNLVAKLIRGMKVDDAIAQMKFSHKKAGSHVLRVLKVTKHNAWHNHGVEDPSDMYVAESYVGKGQNLRRMRMHAMSRTGRSTKPRTHYYLKLQVGDKPKPKEKLKWWRQTSVNINSLKTKPQRILHSLE
eukprot:m.258171 g.258171  ORF g.258171 m.258171 type:complete len:240 (-) comp36226_c0_seq1:71-790(-)